MKEKGLSLRMQGTWIAAAKIVAYAFSFALPLVVVRYLTQDQIGLYREAFLLITTAVVILPLGFSMSAYYYLSRELERRAAAICNILLFNFGAGGLACLTLFLYPQIVGWILQSDEITRLAPKMGLVIWIWIFAAFLETVALANREPRTATLFIIVSAMSKTLLMGSAVMIFESVEAFIWAAMLQGGIQTLLLGIYLRSRFPGFWKNFDLRFFREHMGYAVPYGLAGVVWLAQIELHFYFAAYKFSAADFAIYAYGCFEVPLISIFTQSATAVLIPQMAALQLKDDRDEMIRLTARAMQKLAIICMPVYAFLLITSHTFIVTLFTEKFEASVPIFVISLTPLVSYILVNDPVVRSYKDLGRIFLLVRTLMLTSLIAVLYFGLETLSMTGLITVVVAAVLAERFFAGAMMVYRLRVGTRHLFHLAGLGKTAVITLAAGVATYIFYSGLKEPIFSAASQIAGLVFERPSLVSFTAGSSVLLASAIVFVAVYLPAAFWWGVIEEDEIRPIRDLVKSVLARRTPHPLAHPHA